MDKTARNLIYLHYFSCALLEGEKEELVYNRKPILPSFEKTINNESEAIVPPVDIQIVDDSPLIKPTQKVVDVLPAEKPVVKKKR